MNFKRLLGGVFALVLIVCTCFIIVSCSGGEVCEHEYGEWKITKQSTCTEQGEKVQICLKCSNAKTESISELGHNAIHYEANDASCVEGGHVEYWQCQTCNKIYGDSACTAEFINANVPATGHTIVHYDKNDADCTNEGNFEYWECTTCSKYFKDASLKNEFESKTEISIAPNGHNLTHTEEIASTCTKNGQAEYWTCSACEKTYKDEACIVEATTLGDLATSVSEHEYVLYIIHERHWEICKDCAAIKDGSSVSHTEGENCESCGYQAGLEFTEHYGYVTVKSGVELEGKAIVPVSYKGNPVTEIESGAFKNNIYLTEIVIPEGITKIGKNAFENCYRLERVNSENNGDILLPNSLLSLGERAFGDVVLAKRVVVGNAVSSIGYACFFNCNSIEEITLPFVGTSNSATAYTAVFGYIFGYTTEYNSVKSESSSTTAFVNTSTKDVEDAIWQYSCCNYKSGSYYYLNGYYYYIPKTIKRVTITNQEKIPTGAFNGCYFIENVVIPENATTIGIAAFQNCTNLKTLNSESEGEFKIPATVSAITDYSFSKCESLQTLTTGVVFKIGNYAFAECKSLLSVNIPKDKKDFGEYSFYKCIALEKIDLGEVSNIGNYAFYFCYSLNSINSDNENTIILPEGLSEIGKYSLAYLGYVKEIVVPNSVKKIGVGAFRTNHALENITLPFIGASRDAGTYTTVFGYIFGYTTEYNSVKSESSSTTTFVNIPTKDVEDAIWQYSCCNYKSGSYYYLNGYYYYIPTSIKNVTITDQSTIPIAAFNGCYFVENIVIPESVTSMGIATFQNCTNLKTLNSEIEGEFNIPANVTSISEYAFYHCEKLESINANSITTIGDYAMQRCTLFKTISFENDEIKTIGEYAFASCPSIKSINIGKVSQIGSYCFQNDYSIMSINSDENGLVSLPSELTTIGKYAFDGLELIKTVVVPQSVTKINAGAFYRCNSIESITLPFVGASRTASSYAAVFGYIFGYTTEYNSVKSESSSTTTFVNIPTKDVEDAIWQYSCCNYKSGSYYYLNGYYYYIPTSIKNVTITDQTEIPVAAFNGCSFIESITLNEDATLGESALQNCEAVVNYKPKEGEN